MSELKIALLIACGAALGALSRHYISTWLNPLFSHLDLGTLVANTLGCFIIGLVMSLLLLVPLSAHAQGFIVTGFLGSLTTFSSFAKEIVHRWNGGNNGEAIMVLFGHLALGISATVLALWLGSKLWKVFF